MKKILGATTAILLLSASGAYYYCAQEFSQQAQNLVTMIEKAKPIMTFDSVEIDKYRFQIRLKNPRIDNKSTLNAVPKGEPISFDMANTMIVSYHPLTKKVSLAVQEHEFLAHLIQGQQNQELKYVGEGDFNISISFTKHPYLNNLDFQTFLTTIKEFSVHRPKTSLIDVQINKKLASLDPSFLDIKTHFPENDQEDAQINLNYNFNNVNVNRDFFKTLKKLIVGAMPDITKRIIAQSLFNNIEIYTQNTTEKGEGAFKLKMSVLNQLINHSYDMKQGFPTINAFYKADGKSNISITKIDFNINTESKFLKMKLDMSNKFETEMRAYFVSHLEEIMSFVPNTLSDKDLLDITPDFASLGNMKTSLDLEANLEKLEGKIDLTTSTDQYSIDAKGDYSSATGGKVVLEITNHEQLFADLNSYLDRVFSHAEIKAFDTQGTQEQIRNGLLTGKTTLESMGKKEQRDGKTVLKVEQALPGIPIVPGGGIPQLPKASS